MENNSLFEGCLFLLVRRKSLETCRDKVFRRFERALVSADVLEGKPETATDVIMQANLLLLIPYDEYDAVTQVSAAFRLTTVVIHN